jgi:AraC-like DNA-binding protein
MIGCGTATFTDPEDFRASLRGRVIDLLQTGGERFRARLTWLSMRQLSVVQAEENAPRIAFLSLPPASVFVSFPLANEPVAYWNGVALGRSRFMLHAAGGKLHQRTTGRTRWGMASLPRASLLAYARALLGRSFQLPSSTAILSQPSAAIAKLQRLHVQACRLAETKPDVASHAEVTRALEQDLVHALVDCISTGVHDNGREQRHGDIMARFEEVLDSRSDRPLFMSELAAVVGVPQRTLRMICDDFLGMGPLAYARLRRLNLARRALLTGDASSLSVAGVARTYGFSELGRFAAAYRAIFAEPPSATLRAADSRRGDIFRADVIR